MGEKERDDKFTLDSGQIWIVIIDNSIVRDPGFYLDEIRHETGHRTFQNAGVAFQNEFVNDAALVKLFDHWKSEKKRGVSGWQKVLKGTKRYRNHGSRVNTSCLWNLASFPRRRNLKRTKAPRTSSPPNCHESRIRCPPPLRTTGPQLWIQKKFWFTQKELYMCKKKLQTNKSRKIWNRSWNLSKYTPRS